MPSPCNKLYAFSESYTKEHAIDIADVQIKTYIFNPEMEGVQKFLYIKQSGFPGPDDGERHSYYLKRIHIDAYNLFLSLFRLQLTWPAKQIMMTMTVLSIIYSGLMMEMVSN